jgi:hypothetical protein
VDCVGRSTSLSTDARESPVTSSSPLWEREGPRASWGHLLRAGGDVLGGIPGMAAGRPRTTRKAEGEMRWREQDIVR